MGSSRRGQSDPPLGIEDATQRSQPIMRTVTQRRLAAVLTTTKEHALAGISCVFHWRDARILVTAIAEGLLAALAAGAPKVGFAFFNLNGMGRFLRDHWCCHAVLVDDAPARNMLKRLKVNCAVIEWSWVAVGRPSPA